MSQRIDARRNSKSFPSRILSRIGNTWIPYEKNRLQLNGGTSHENPDEISVVPDSAQTPWIYLVTGRAGRTLAGELNNLGVIPKMSAATPPLRVAQNTDSDETLVQRTNHSK